MRGRTSLKAIEGEGGRSVLEEEDEEDVICDPTTDRLRRSLREGASFRFHCNAAAAFPCSEPGGVGLHKWRWCLDPGSTPAIPSQHPT